MRKLLVSAIAVALVGAALTGSARAEDSSGLEISGNITSVTGWQRSTQNGTTARTPLGNAGLLGDNLAAIGGSGTDTFGFYVDQVEVDLAKSFGENIRVRADLDFSPAGPGSGAEIVEQAYTTANIPAGNGIELLVGRFNSGIGLDPIDRNELRTVSFSMPHRVLLPHNLTGARLGYDWSENTRLEFYIVNDLSDNLSSTDVPSLGMNLSYAWGEEGNKSWVKFSGAAGPEKATKKGYTFLTDLSASWAVSDAFRLGIEGDYRQDDGTAGANAKNFAGALSGTYAFSDVWDGTLRYSFVKQSKAVSGVAANEVVGSAGLGYIGYNHEFVLATGYQITDGARFVLEGRGDLAKATGVTSGLGYGLGAKFAYSF